MYSSHPQQVSVSAPHLCQQQEPLMTSCGACTLSVDVGVGRVQYM